MGELQIQRQKQEDSVFKTEQGMKEARALKTASTAPLMEQKIHLPVVKNLPAPDEDILQEAREAEELEMASYQLKQDQALQESKKKYKMQEQLKEPLKKEAEKSDLSMGQLMKLKDQELVDRREELDQQNPYLQLRYQLIRNKYYALLPADQMDKLSEEEITRKLDELGTGDVHDQNAELIDYYRTLLDLKGFEAR